MGLRFRKSVKIAPGVRVNMGKKSASISVGTKGAHHTISTTGKRTTSVGIPGTGISHVTTTSSKKHKAGKGEVREATAPQRSPRTYKVAGIILLVLAVVALLIGLPTIAFGGWLFLIIAVPCVVFGVKYIKMAKQPQEEESIE